MADVNYSVVDFSDLSAVSDGKTLLYKDNQVCKSENNLSELIQSAVDKQVENKLDTSAFSTVSGNFLTAHQQIPESANWNETYETVTANSGTWNNVSSIKSFTSIAGIEAETSADSLQITNGDNVSITTTNKTITISAKDTTYDENDFIGASHLSNIQTASGYADDWNTNKSNVVLASGYAQNWSDNSATIIANGNSGVSALNTITANSAAWSNGAFVTAALTPGENPVPNVPEPINKVIYLTKEEGSTKTDPYTEWIYSDKWEIIGETTVDLSNYYKKTETSSKDQLSTEFEKKLDSSVAQTTYAPISLTATVNTLSGSSATWNEVSAKFDSSAITSYYQKSETSAASAISAALDLKEDKIFVAVYNNNEKTSFADIKAAYDAGKKIYLKLDNFNADNPGGGGSPYNYIVPLNDFYTIPGGSAPAGIDYYIPTYWFQFDFLNDGNPQKLIIVKINDNDSWFTQVISLQDKLNFEGENNTITAINSSAVGGGSTGEYVPLSATICTIGNTNTAKANGEVIFIQGVGNKADECSRSVIFGSNNITDGEWNDNYSVAIGNNNTADAGFAYGTSAYANDAVAFGENLRIDNKSIGVGKNISADDRSLAAGESAQAYYKSLAIGQNVKASTYSLAIGDNNSAVQDSIVVGRNNSAKYSSLVQGNGNSALGNYSVAVGERNYIYNDAKEAIAIGKDNSAYYDGAIALGTNGYALGTYTFVVGNGNSATNGQAIALGQNNSAHGEFAVALSQGNTANGNNSFAVGYNNLAAGSRTVAMGFNCTAEGSNSVAMGNVSYAKGTSTVALGNANTANGSYSFAAGNGSLANTDTSIALGKQTQAKGNYSVALGYLTTANNEGALAEGYKTYAFGQHSHAEGTQTTANSKAAHSEGISTKALAEGSHAEGAQTSANGQYSHSEGYQTTAGGYYSHAEGQSTTAQGQCSHAEGNQTNTTANYAHAEGQLSVAGVYGHAEGRETTAIGATNGNYAAHAEGYNTKALNGGTHAEGSYTSAEGNVAHAEGYQTSAIGEYSHSEGWSTSAAGKASHAAGKGTLSNYECETVVGSYNILAHDELPASCKPIFVVGNGSANNSRSDAFIVTSAGVASANDFISNGVSLSGMLDLYNILTARPVTGTYTLKCVNGILSWVEDSNIPANAVGLNNEPVGVNGDYFTVGEGQ